MSLDKEIMEAINLNEGSVTIDGELIDSKLYTFDYLMTGIPYKERLKLLEANYGDYNMKNIIVIYTAYTKEEKQKLYDELKARNAEGIVFKDLRAMYTPGRPASGGTQVKFKFCETCTCIVCGRSSTKRSVALALLDENGKELTVGNVTIYPNFAIPNINDLVEIKYLYAYKGGSLYQPVYKGVRTDLDMVDCKLSQLKYKAGTV